MDILVDKLVHFAYFAGQTVVIVAGILVILSSLFGLIQKNQDKDDLEVENLNEKFKSASESLKLKTLSKKQAKTEKKKTDKEKKKKEKAASKEAHEKKRLFVINFEGDIKASAVDSLREEINAILGVAEKGEEVVVNIESPGGVVHGYGLAAAQLMRLKKAGLKLTVCVDKVAASGGYMMACVADQIYAAPFAIIGSIGVLAQVPNFNKLLKKHDIEYKEITAGDYKRTLSLFGEITEKGEKKFTEQISDTHQLFKDFVHSHRPQLDLNEVGTGEYWFAKRAFDLKLVDEIMTSDEYLLSRLDDAEMRLVKHEVKKKLLDKISSRSAHWAESVCTRVTSSLFDRWLNHQQKQNLL